MKNTKKQNHQIHSHNLLFIVVFTLLAVVVYFTQLNSVFFKTSVVSFPEHAPFNGTSYPIKKVLNWVKAPADKWTATYSTLSSTDLVDIPVYEPEKLTIANDTLKWGNAADDVIRIAKTTYSVPYMGNYKLDGKENVGSHPAVDIKVPEGTPVYAMANGTVVKVSNISSGFGHHVVLRHNNFPSLDDPNAKTLVYSSYSHLSDILVSVGDVVKKGQQIALSGKTGTATTPHLHFQLDNSNSPWNPYWPFTTQEAYNAGLDFFGAINAGLGKENALASTINPMKYVEKYKDYAVADSYVDTSTNTDTPVDTTPVVDTPPTTTVDNPPTQTEPSVLQFTVETSSQYYVAQEPIFFIYMKDQYGNHFEQALDDSVVVTSTEGNFVANKVLLGSLDFDSNGKVTNSLKELKQGRDKVKITYKGETFYSEWFDIVNPSETEQLFSDVPATSKYADATKYLASNGIVNGYPDGTFKPDQAVSRAEALKLIYEAAKLELSNGKLSFKDTKKTEWFTKYIYTAYKNGVVKGYEDNTFKPANIVTKAEFFKMLFEATEVNVGDSVSQAPYKDVNVTDWFAPYVSYAKTAGIVDGGGNFNPTKGMSRGEVADALYRMILAKNS
ncbi:MAG: S-layer homology domain-containing protein [Candidatus Gracilibacteria bacterium]|jgi:murein DD-endopeptidase MepM/ murein hydrolase activator NlpD